MKIAVVKNNNSPAVQYYRNVGVFPAIERQLGGQISFDYFYVQEVMQNGAWSVLYPYDVVFIDKPSVPEAFELIFLVKRMGASHKVWIDIDDHFFDIPLYNKAWEHFSNPRIIRGIQESLKVADLITVTTPLLHDVYSEFNSNVQVIPNAWNDYDWPLLKAQPANVVNRIIWRGSNAHGGDLRTIAKIINEDIQKDPGFDILFYGWDNDWINMLHIDRKRQVKKWLGMFQYFNTFFTVGADYLIYPLAKNDFNSAKSNIAWIEATIAGTATIAPAHFEAFNQPGVIRYENTSHLKDLLTKIKRGKINKEEQVALSQQALQERYKLSEITQMRIEAISGLFNAKVKQLEVVK